MEVRSIIELEMKRVTSQAFSVFERVTMPSPILVCLSIA